MNIRQKTYKANRINGMNQHNAARAAGYSNSYSRQACRIERQVEVSIKDALEQAGLTEKFQAELLKKLTDNENPTIQMAALRHIAELKKQTRPELKIDQSKHTHYTVKWQNDEKIRM